MNEELIQLELWRRGDAMKKSSLPRPPSWVPAGPWAVQRWDTEGLAGPCVRGVRGPV